MKFSSAYSTAQTAAFVSCSIPFQIVRDVFDATTGEMLTGQVIFNADATINSIFPKLVPLMLTLGVYGLYAKKKIFAATVIKIRRRFL